ncbi:aquaporin [Streptomyces sp. NBC_01092]|uniref:aquaporin n=1 Tax=Streptomyces sp. NBC_01092 TaxID=2903748 RepID=UPI003867E725|nr:aquaporin [Streptomyces sp. NBC_01092]
MSRTPNPPIARHAAYEFVLTTALFFSVLTVIRWLAHPGSPIAISDPDLLFPTVGTLVALLIGGLMVTPPGRASGGHMHPGVSVFVWLTGGMPGRAVLPFVAAQLAGSLAATGLARLVWGDALTQIGYAAVHPAASWGDGLLFLVEGGCLVPIFLGVALVASRPTTAKYIPVVIAVGVGLVVATLVPYSGASINPARALGPAIFAGHHDHLWVYLTASVLSPLLVALTLRALARRAQPTSA